MGSELTQRGLEGEVANGGAIVRPPGHPLEATHAASAAAAPPVAVRQAEREAAEGKEEGERGRRWARAASETTCEGATSKAARRLRFCAATCVEIKILRRVRAESSRRPPRHRRDACSMAWRCRFLAARPSQVGRVIAEK